MRCTRPYSALFALIFAPAVALCVMAGCDRPHPAAVPASAPPPVAAVTASEYVGSAACNGCHPEEFRSHEQTNHAHTFRIMDPDTLGKNAPPLGPLPHTNLIIGLYNSRFVLGMPSTGKMRYLDYALGSGKTGTTYITIMGDDQVFEMRDSYFPREKRWYVTPGQQKTQGDPNSVGKNYPLGDSRRCILCHAVTVSSDSLHPDPKLIGVGCESCHGPGSAHIAAVSASGTTDSKMERMSSWGGKQINELCGRCHRSVADVLTQPPAARSTTRFMVYGLSLSPCFQQSGDRLTCITCHDPHANASTDIRRYERICLSCHSAAAIPAAAASATGTQAVFRRPVKGHVCPVNSRSGCISCHMPSSRMFTDNSLPIFAADHWIRIHRH